MKLSIRAKVCLALAAFTLFCATTLAVIMIAGFNPYYYQMKKNTMTTASKDISAIYEAQGEDGFDEIDQISQKSGADIYIVDNGKLAYSSRPDRRVVMGPPKFPKDEVVMAGNSKDKDGTEKQPEAQMMPPRHIREMMDIMNGQEPQDQDIGKVTFYELGNRYQLLDLVYQIREHVFLIISQPVAPIQESVEIAKRFALICGILWLLVAIIGALIFSRKLTKPLLKLKEQSLRMTRLDFSSRWQGKGDDEISQLGNSLNQLSDQLHTALNSLQETNTQLQDQLDKANEIEHMRKEFISAVSHELKTPLAIIQGYAEGLDTIAADDTMRERYCRIIRSETEKMDRLVKDLLDLSRLETGSFRIEQTNFDFCALAEDSRERFANAAKSKGIHMEWQLPEELMVYGDPERIGQILGNYLSNAIDYTEAGKCIRISMADEGNRYRIEVYNQGITIAPENQSRLWSAFFKVDKSRNRTFGGHGLGLSIVAALVKLHGQDYGMHNVDDGVVFWFTVAKENR